RFLQPRRQRLRLDECARPLREQRQLAVPGRRGGEEPGEFPPGGGGQPAVKRGGGHRVAVGNPPAVGGELPEARHLRPDPLRVGRPDLAEVDHSLLAHARTWTVPARPSTLIRSPVLTTWVAIAVPTTQGMPYSRLTMAAWVSDPPVSHTQAAMIPNAGVHSVVVPPHTRISPGSTRCRSPTVVITRATPSTTPLAAGNPRISVNVASAPAAPGAPDEPAAPASPRIVSMHRPDSPNTSIMIGSGTTSGIVPSIGGSEGPRFRQCSKYARRSGIIARRSAHDVAPPPDITSYSSGLKRDW